MFEAGKYYIISAMKIYDSVGFSALPNDLVNHMNGVKFVAVGGLIDTVHYKGRTLVVNPEWCVSGEEDDLI